ncbi:hypothetical protein HTZ84_16265 [Haloterrigena sp. SYSU A558-1]|uniref:Uncharacterized protein n=1 Tax=Haloterrigena gelatinilytica TaxID=2741724 RepID=A0A8J8KDM8_9EURY|nr:hypothetical protein [Haloterrigena gelatinilytica]NUB90343.1 hypothetical protein [Haloterrigena gelatinilytica]NUC73837.1 hypothetical protein [Haloterrigena gelatinilytica]
MQESTLGRPGRDPFETLVDVLAEASRYDLLLGVVPVAFTVALVAAHVLRLPVVHAMFVAATIGALVVIDACYLNPPVDQGSP